MGKLKRGLLERATGFVVMKILCVGQTENKLYEAEVMKQTVLPDQVTINIDEYPASGIDNRRRRIAENHKKLWHIVKAYEPDLVWQIEGDSVLEPDTLERLLARYDKLKGDDFGYVSGVEVGRHGIYHIGAWHVADDRQSFRSLDHKTKKVTEVDGTGFYSLLAPAEVWLKGKCEWNGERYGPDVVWGLSLREQGYKIYVDPTIEIGHRTDHGVIGLDNINLCTVEFTKGKDAWTYKVLQ